MDTWIKLISRCSLKRGSNIVAKAGIMLAVGPMLERMV